jgi:AraC-like DNA-binding protein
MELGSARSELPSVRAGMAPPIPHDSVAVFARPDFVRHLRTLLASENVAYPRSWNELRSTLAAPTIRTLIVDPIIGGVGNGRPLSDLARTFPQVAFVAYAAFDAESLRATAKLSHHGPRFYEVLVHASDIGYHRVAQAILRASAHHLVTEVVGPLERGIGRLPQGLREAVFDLFSRPGRYTDVRDLATQSHSTVQTLYRQFESADLGTPKRIVTVARICRGYLLLRTSDVLARDVAASVGYRRSTTFSENCAEIFGCGPSTLRHVADEQEFALALLDWLYKPSRRNRRISASQPADTAVISDMN